MRPISTRGHFERICNAIHHELFRTQHLKRERLEIGLLINCTEITDMADFVCNISRILLPLNGSNTEQWMVTLERYDQYDLALGSMTKAICTSLLSCIQERI